MPETVFVKDGAIECITTMCKDRCLTFDTKTKITDSIKVREKLIQCVQERRRDMEPLGKHK